MKIPQYFLLECSETGNTQVCTCILYIFLIFKSILSRFSWYFYHKIVSFGVFSLSGFVHPDDPDGSCSGASLELCCSGSCISDLSQTVWGGEFWELGVPGCQRLLGSEVGGQADYTAGRLTQGDSDTSNIWDMYKQRISSLTWQDH